MAEMKAEDFLKQIEEHRLEALMQLGIMLYKRFKQYYESRKSDKLSDFPELIELVRQVTGYSDAQICRVAELNASFITLLRKHGTRPRSHKIYARALQRFHFEFYTQNARKIWELNPEKYRLLEEQKLAVSSPDTLEMRKYLEHERQKSREV
jgi:hypothetical protein